jgi:hypothetical protein
MIYLQTFFKDNSHSLPAVASCSFSLSTMSVMVSSSSLILGLYVIDNPFTSDAGIWCSLMKQARHYDVVLTFD